MSHPSRVWIGVAGAVALAVFVLLIGLVTTGLRLAVAGLSPGHGLFVVPIWHSILTGLILTGIGCATFVVSCVAAYVAAWRRWDFRRHDWQDIVEKKGVRSAWDSLHADTVDGEHRRAARKARYRHVSTRSKATREQTLAKVTRAAGLTMVADSRERSRGTSRRPRTSRLGRPTSTRRPSVRRRDRAMSQRHPRGIACCGSSPDSTCSSLPG